MLSFGRLLHWVLFSVHSQCHQMHQREATRCTRFPLPSRKEPDTSQDDSEQRWIELPQGPACLSINSRRHPGRLDSSLENLSSLPKFGCMNPPLHVAADKHSNRLQHATAFHSSFCSSLFTSLLSQSNCGFHILNFSK